MLICNGFVTREFMQGESNKILNVLTKEYGLITATARGAVKISGKNSGSAQLFSYSEFSIEKVKGWYYVQSAEPKRSFYNIRKDIDKLSLAQYFAQIINECIVENQDSGDILRLTLNTFHYLENGKRSPALLKSIFELRFLSDIGLMPDLLACQRCAEYLPENPVFLMSKGVFYCCECLKYVQGYIIEDSFPVSKSMLHIIRYIALSDLDKIFMFKISEDSEKILNIFTERYLKTQLGRSFSALDFYNSLVSINQKGNI